MGPRLTPLLVHKSARMEGFLVFHYEDLYPRSENDLAQWLESGQIKIDETWHEGTEAIPKAFIGMMKGENIGKMLVKIVDKDSS